MPTQQQSPLYSEYRRRFSFSDMYRSLLHMPSAIGNLKKNRKSQALDSKFIERIMLAVTEVNGCAICSYAHTRMALREGLTEEEIADLLNGDTQTISPYEAKAIAFAQHYADTRGYSDKDAIESLSAFYGPIKTASIISAIQVIMVGNMYGIPYSAFVSRLRGKPYKNSSFGYEISMLAFGLISMPVAFIHGLVRATFEHRR